MVLVTFCVTASGTESCNSLAQNGSNIRLNAQPPFCYAILNTCTVLVWITLQVFIRWNWRNKQKPNIINTFSKLHCQLCKQFEGKHVIRFGCFCAPHCNSFGGDSRTEALTWVETHSTLHKQNHKQTTPNSNSERTVNTNIEKLFLCNDACHYLNSMFLFYLILTVWAFLSWVFGCVVTCEHEWSLEKKWFSERWS